MNFDPENEVVNPIMDPVLEEPEMPLPTPEEEPTPEPFELPEMLSGSNDNIKYLPEDYLELLKKEGTLSKEDVKAIFDSTLVFLGKDTSMHDITIIPADLPNAKNVQIGYVFDPTNKVFSHLVTVNYDALLGLDKPKIVSIASRCSVHLSTNEKGAKDLESGSITSENYEATLNNVLSPEEIDKESFFRGKLIFQKAVHDVEQADQKEKFWACYNSIDEEQKNKESTYGEPTRGFKM